MKRIYVARDKDGELYFYKEEPEKVVNARAPHIASGLWNNARCNGDVTDCTLIRSNPNVGSSDVSFFKELFKDVKWEDKEPKVILFCW